MKTMKEPLTITIILISLYLCSACSSVQSSKEAKGESELTTNNETINPGRSAIDTANYRKILADISNGDTTGKWPAKNPIPLPGSIFPFHRVLAFYGNLYSKRMGILGELPKGEMLAKLKGEVKKWQAADTSLPVIPALHYVAVTAQGAGGKDGKYRYRMPFHQIDTIVNWAKEITALTFLDIQVGHSTVAAEVPVLETYLKMPTVHLGIDPEFSLKNGEVPGSKIGTFNPDDINAAIDYLASLVKKYNLPPKILIVHRFTQGMVRGTEKIKVVPKADSNFAVLA